MDNECAKSPRIMFFYTNFTYERRPFLCNWVHHTLSSSVYEEYPLSASIALSLSLCLSLSFSLFPSLSFSLSLSLHHIARTITLTRSHFLFLSLSLSSHMSLFLDVSLPRWLALALCPLLSFSSFSPLLVTYLSFTAYFGTVCGNNSNPFA